MTLWKMSSLCCLLKRQFYEKVRKGEDEAQVSGAGGGDVALLV